MNAIPTISTEMSADAGELLMVILAVVSLAIIVCGAIFQRRDRCSLLVCLGAIPVLLLARSRWHWDEGEFLFLLAVESAAAGMIGYMVMRSKRLQFSRAAACIGGAVNSVLTVLAAAELTRYGAARPLERGYWMIWLLPVAGGGAVVVALTAWVIRHFWKGLDVSPLGRAPSDEEQRSIVKMLAEGKISSQEASELLNSLGGKGRPGDELPLGRNVVHSLLGGLLVIVGFMLPWAHVRVGGMTGYQAGYNVGLLGWLILSLGLLPAILSCIPALDRHLRQGLLRLLLAGAGSAFALSLATRHVAAAREFPPVGILVVLVGFALQLLSAVKQSGILARHRGSRQ